MLTTGGGQEHSATMTDEYLLSRIVELIEIGKPDSASRFLIANKSHIRPQLLRLGIEEVAYYKNSNKNQEAETLTALLRDAAFLVLDFPVLKAELAPISGAGPTVESQLEAGVEMLEKMAMSHFLMDLLTSHHGRAEALFPLIGSNLHLLTSRFKEDLKMLCRVNIDQHRKDGRHTEVLALGRSLVIFSEAFSRYPHGDRELNLSIAATGYELATEALRYESTKLEFADALISLGLAKIDYRQQPEDFWASGFERTARFRAETVRTHNLRSATIEFFIPATAMLPPEIEWALRRTTQTAQAINHFTKALELYDGHRKKQAEIYNYMGLATTDKYTVSRSENDRADAQAFFLLAIRKDQTSHATHANLARLEALQVNSKQDFQEAQRLFRQAIHLLAEDKSLSEEERLLMKTEYLINLGETTRLQGKAEESNKIFLESRNLLESCLRGIDDYRSEICLRQLRYVFERLFESTLNDPEASLEHLLRHKAIASTGGKKARFDPLLPLAELSSRIPDGTAILECFLVDGRAITYILTKREDVFTFDVVNKDNEEFIDILGPLDRLLHLLHLNQSCDAEELFALLRDVAEALRLPEIVDKTRDLKNLVISPHLSLHLIPFHALPVTHGDFLIDRFSSIRYVSHITNIKESSARCVRLNSAFSAANPDRNLPFTEMEVDFLSTVVENHTNVRGYSASKSIVLECCNTGHDLLHFACHGSFDHMVPDLSFLLMTNGEHLSLADLRDVDFSCTNLAILSACSSGATDFRSSEYAGGFPRELVSAGCDAAIGNFWSVDDMATSLITIRCLDYLACHGSDAALALTNAQKWIKGSSASEIVKYVSSLSLASSHKASIKLHMSGHEPTDLPFGSVHLWGAGYCFASG